jgi:DNA polymerase
MIDAQIDGTFESWRARARQLLARDTPPGEILWHERFDPQAALFVAESDESAALTQVRVPKRFMELARVVACHREPAKWALLYRLLYRLTHGERDVLEIETDDDVRKALLMESAVRQDGHRMRAFVRFRKVVCHDREWYVAWYRPDHFVLEHNSRFFLDRFGSMRWAILTPDKSVYWDLRSLRFGSGVPCSQAPQEDALEDLWRAYYTSTFNPARANAHLLRSHMPVRHWPTLPEASTIPDLLGSADTRTAEMLVAAPQSATPFVPSTRSLDELRTAIPACQGCELYRCATHAVFGEGPAEARVVLVGEQPGDAEDLQGRPFVGPAGQLLDRALADAGVERSTLYVTNAVKHFKFIERGKRRLHQTPRSEVPACRPWLEAELEAIKPKLIVCLGATAAQSLLGREVRVLRERGRLFQTRWAPQLTVTVHPSMLLRIPEPEAQAREYAAFVRDLAFIRTAAGIPRTPAPAR